MLRICTDILPDTDVTYVAFRTAFLDTLERIVLAGQLGLEPESFGYLTEVPFLRNVRPAVQLDLLAETWSRHRDGRPYTATLVDESVVYAACETTARLLTTNPGHGRRVLARGPRDLTLDVNENLARAVLALHLELTNEGDFLLISQFQDIPPVEARRLKKKFGFSQQAAEPMFDVLARWHVGDGFLPRTAGLLTPAETDRAAAVLRLNRPVRSLESR